MELATNYREMWISPLRKPQLEDRWMRKSQLLMEIGKKHERKVYSQLVKIPGVKYNPAPEEVAGKITLSEKYLNEIHQLLLKNSDQPIILLEHEFKNPISFFKDLFSSKSEKEEIPVDYSDQRPDILIIGNKPSNKHSLELLFTGEIAEISINEEKKRFGINIIDIKSTSRDNVGKKQFVEIFYYMRTFAYYLHELGLDDKFFISVDGNGIFPDISNPELAEISDVSQLFDLIVKIRWSESSRIFSKVYECIKKLWNQSPCSIESVPLNIQIKCGYCFFLTDCKQSLGLNDPDNPENWSLKLIPYTSMSISQQLINMGFETIGDLLKNIANITIGSYPQPLYPELPLLELKARAIVEKRMIQPSQGHAHSYSLPRFSPISITFAVESDPSNEKVFAIAFNLSMTVNQKLSYCLIFDYWWKIWKDALGIDKKPEQIHEELNNILFLEIPLEVVVSFYNSIRKLQNFQIKLKGELYRKKNANGNEEILNRKQTLIRYNFVTVNEDRSNETEFIMIKLTLLLLFDIINLCNIVENYVVVEGYNQDSFFGPDTAVFYWSSQQSENIGDLLERNLKRILGDSRVSSKFTHLISLFTPSDSEVSHPYQNKKIYDVQKFVESMVGFPGIINYTWHEMAKKLLDSKISQRFWIPHYDYMDFNKWHEFLLEKDIVKKKEMKDQISRQMSQKIYTISRLKQEFQNRLKDTISKHSRPVNNNQYRDVLLGSQFHPLSHVWYLFSKLTTANDEQECELYRTMYPEFSIGKLSAAKVSNLTFIRVSDKKHKYSLNITGLSSNMKINRGDRVLLLPEPLRDIKTSKRLRMWEITIEEMYWESNVGGYRVVTKESYTNLHDEYRKDLEFQHRLDEYEPECQWYFYPTSFDAWSKKLYNSMIGRSGLLQRKDFGTNWLGKRLSYLWDINSRSKLQWPEQWEFNINSIFLFAPEIFKDTKLIDGADVSENLITQIHPPPDLSQKSAILKSLNHVIYGIQGPPGTGKSQTIAALIDEYVCRSKRDGKKKIRILITAFSYSALKVIIEIIRKGRHKDGKPSASSQVQLIFIRPEYRQPIPHIDGYPDVEDLMRYGNTWKFNDQKRSVTRSKLLEESLGDYCIIFANAFQLFHLPTRVNPSFHFDFICIDEASQLPTDQIMASLYFLNRRKLHLIVEKRSVEPGMEIKSFSEVEKLNLSPDENLNLKDLTKLIIVGDYNQLPPVQTVTPPKNLEKVLDSAFGYYVKHHKINASQLKVNYRSHKDIVGFTSKMGIYENISAFSANAEKTLEGKIENVQKSWVKEVLLPERVIGTLIHNNKFEMGVSLFEAKLVTEIVIGFYNMRKPATKEDERIFWKESIGVVAPHNAQGRLIIHKIYDKLTDEEQTLSLLETEELMNLLKAAVVSVEKFQGSDRDFILSSIGISDIDQLKSEAEFIYNLNRFNVLTSRAKNKFILICSEEFLDYIPNDRQIMEEAAHIRELALNYCDKENLILIPLNNEENERIRFRYK